MWINILYIFATFCKSEIISKWKLKIKIIYKTKKAKLPFDMIFALEIVPDFSYIYYIYIDIYTHITIYIYTHVYHIHGANMFMEVIFSFVLISLSFQNVL